MKIYTDPDTLPKFRNPVVTVGSFDGVHRGHDAILDRMKELAREIDGETVVVTFSPHPRSITSESEPIGLLNTVEEKAILLRDKEIVNMVIIPFTERFRNLSPEEYISEYLKRRLGTHTLLAGYNHHFGRDKEGDGTSLASLAEKFGIRVEIMPRQTVGNKKVSSTEIRKHLAAGKMTKAAELLGYKYFIKARIDDDGVVVVPDKAKLIPPDGTYFVAVLAENEPLRETSVEIFHNGQIEVQPLPDSSFTGEAVIIFD